jgi:hypothetical protein
MALGGLYNYGCNCTCTGSLESISTIGSSLHPVTRKEKPRLPEDAKLTEKLLQPYPSTRMSVSFLSSSSEVSLIPFGSLI